MTLTDGLVNEFLSLLGFRAVTSDGIQIAFIVTAAILAVVIVSFMTLLFKFFVYLNRH